jgi:hypothetical protein
MRRRSGCASLNGVVRYWGAVLLAGILIGCGGGATDAGSTTFVVATTTPVTTTSAATEPITTTLNPLPIAITGYGDFSGVDYADVDRFLVMRLTVQCMQDHGFPVTLIPPGDGIDFAAVPLDQNLLAQRYLDACRAGLNLPPGRNYTPEELRELYRIWVEEVIPCLEDLGYTAPELPTEDYVAENYYLDPYDPYGNVPVFKLNEAYAACPLHPSPWIIAP